MDSPHDNAVSLSIDSRNGSRSSFGAGTHNSSHNGNSSQQALRKPQTNQPWPLVNDCSTTTHLPSDNALTIDTIASALLNQSSDLVFLLDCAGTILYANTAALKFFGCDSEINGKAKISSLDSSAEAICVEQLLTETLQQQSNRILQHQLQNHNGKRVGMLSRSQLVDIATPHGQGVVYLCMTPQQDQDGSIIPELEELSRQNRLATVAHMAAGLVHELNQPLTSISLYTRTGLRLINENNADQKEVFEILAEIARQTEHASGIVQRFRNFLRKRPSHRSPLAIQHVLHEAVALCQPIFREAGFQPKILAPGPDVLIYADEVQITQVMLNLLRNACEAMAETPPEDRGITISLQLNSDMVQVTISDRGFGLSVNRVQDLFQSFRTTKATGLGIGLTLCREIIHSHGGNIWAKPNPDCGASFNFTLPIFSS